MMVFLFLGGVFMEKGTRAVALEKGGLRFVRPLNTANSCFGFFCDCGRRLAEGGAQMVALEG